MSKTTLFPYKDLPQMTSEDVQLQKKMLRTYAFFSGHKDILKNLRQILSEVINDDIEISITHLDVQNIEDISASLSKQALIGLFSIEPYGQRGALIFDSMLAKLMIHNLLSPSKTNKANFLNLVAKPITLLEEATVQYILISILENLTRNLNVQNFNLSYDSIQRDPLNLKTVMAGTSKYAVFSVCLKAFQREFYLKFVIPFVLNDAFAIDEFNEGLINYRAKQFGSYNIDLILEVARVSLPPNDVNHLQEGDILLFDSSKIDFKNKKLTGQAEIKLESCECDDGYVVDLNTSTDLIRAKIVSAT